MRRQIDRSRGNSSFSFTDISMDAYKHYKNCLKLQLGFIVFLRVSGWLDGLIFHVLGS